MAQSKNFISESPDTDGVSEGAVNRYFTEQRTVDAAFDDAVTNNIRGWTGEKIQEEIDNAAQLTAQVIEAGPNSTPEAPTILIKNTVGGVVLESNEFPLPSSVTQTKYSDIKISTGGVATLTRDADNFYASLELTEDTAIALQMSVGDRVKGIAILNGFTLSLPFGAEILRGEFLEGYKNHFEIEKVGADAYIVQIHSHINLVETLVFRQDLAGGLFVTGEDVNNINAGSADPSSETKYSILDQLGGMALPEGNYRFRLVYDTGTDITWEQDTNPVTGPAGSTTGLKILQATNYDSNFFGMALSTSASTYYNGYTGGNWWYALGTLANHQGGIPAKNPDIAQVVELYVWSVAP